MPEVKLNVKLLSHTPSPAETIALAAKLCYSDSDIVSLRKAVEGNSDAFVEKLMSMGHLSPFEHASFTFGVEGVSRSLLAQITRHRIASFSVQSQRYVLKDEITYIVPPSVKALGPDAELEYYRDMKAARYCYERWLSKGVPPEDARFVLPEGHETRMIITMNARELMHFFSLRCCGRAQWEIRSLAWSMLGIARREAPAIFKNAGPGCISGECPEGKMSCGRQEDMRALSEALNSAINPRSRDQRIVEFIKDRI